MDRQRHGHGRVACFFFGVEDRRRGVQIVAKGRWWCFSWTRVVAQTGEHHFMLQLLALLIFASFQHYAIFAYTTILDEDAQQHSIL
jgi:hypothetical protein